MAETPTTASRILADCPHCGRGRTGFADIDGATTAPSAGDSSVCLFCGLLGMFVETEDAGVLAMRKPSAVEVADLLKQAHVVRAVSMTALLRARLNRRKS